MSRAILALLVWFVWTDSAAAQTTGAIVGRVADETGAVLPGVTEVGVRSILRPAFQTALSVWWLDLDSELVFVGDAGTIEASRPSRRAGIEWSNALRLTPWLAVDADLAYARARFRNVDPSGDRIPGAIGGAASIGGYVEALKGFSAIRSSRGCSV